MKMNVNRILLRVFLVFVLYFSIDEWYLNRKSDKENLELNFKGNVEEVRYDVKGIPYVKVNGKEYHLNDGYNFEEKIEKGDSIIKNKRSNVYKLVKPSGQILIFRN